jgi:hypothetical protein
MIKDERERLVAASPAMTRFLSPGKWGGGGGGNYPENGLKTAEDWTAQNTNCQVRLRRKLSPCPGRLVADGVLVRASWRRAKLHFSAIQKKNWSQAGSCPPSLPSCLLSIRVLENHVLRGTRIDRKISARDVLSSLKETTSLFQLP